MIDFILYKNLWSDVSEKFKIWSQLTLFNTYFWYNKGYWKDLFISLINEVSLITLHSFIKEFSWIDWKCYCKSLTIQVEPFLIKNITPFYSKLLSYLRK